MSPNYHTKSGSATHETQVKVEKINEVPVYRVVKKKVTVPFEVTVEKIVEVPS